MKLTVGGVTVDFDKASIELTAKNTMPGAMIALVLRETVPLPLLVVLPPPTQNAESTDSNPVAVTWPLHNTTGGAQITGGIEPYVVTYTPTRGSSFAVGSTQVTIDVESLDGQTRQDFFLVEVVEEADPPYDTLTIVGPGTVTAFTPDGNPVAVTFAALATGGLQPYVFTYMEGAVERFSGNSFAIGAHTIDVTVTDSEGTPNVDTDSFVLTVFDVGNAHGYFNTLNARGDKYKAYSLRPVAGQPITSAHYANQLLAPNQGGYANSNSAGLYITYLPASDTDPNAQDGAKIIIPPFNSGGAVTTLDQPMSASTTGAIETIFFNRSVSVGSSQTLQIGSELVKINGSQVGGPSKSIIRGQFGTTAAAHSAGATVLFSGNSLLNQLRLPIGTTNGNTYFVTWDCFWTDSYLNSGLTNHKCFQFSSGGDGVWFEAQTRYNGGPSSVIPPGWNPITDVAGVSLRSYQPPGGNADWSLSDGNVMGPGTTSFDPILPRSGTFAIRANVWTRYWVRIIQVANDYDLADAWVADETQDAVHVLTSIPLSVRITGTPANSVVKFWLEYNTSTDNYVRGDMRNLVAYARNWIALLNPGDISGLLVKPVGG